MSRMQIGAQLYTVRKDMQTPAQMRESLRRISAMGYKSVQLSGNGPIDPHELRAMLDSFQLTVGATHTSFDRLENEPEQVIAEHRILGCPHTGIGGMPSAFRQGREGVRAFAKRATEVAKRVRDAGMTFFYHNHSFEFVHFGREVAMDVLFNESGPELDFEIDTYWVQNAGADPLHWVKKVAGRMKVVHFKDMMIDSEHRTYSSAVGDGNLNWPALIEACEAGGTEYCMIEQDVLFDERDMFEELSRSYRYLHSLGLE